MSKQEWGLQNGEPASRYRRFGCPKCGAKHKYGHKRQFIQCYRCWYEFSPTHEGRKYEDERLTNLTPEEREKALADINSTPPWRKNKKRKGKKRVAPPPPPPTKWEKIKGCLLGMFNR